AVRARSPTDPPNGGTSRPPIFRVDQVIAEVQKSLLAHRVNSRQRSSTSVAFGAKQTLTEPALKESGFMSTCPRRGTRDSPAVSGAGSRQLRQVIQHHEPLHLGR